MRAYYFRGPGVGFGYSYAGSADYAARNGIGCTPGTAIKGGDGILYNCQMAIFFDCSGQVASES